MRVCINKATGTLIESQSGGSTQAHLDTLLNNAISAGFKAEDIEVKFCTEQEHAQILSATRAANAVGVVKKKTMQEQIDELRLEIEALKAGKQVE